MTRLARWIGLALLGASAPAVSDEPEIFRCAQDDGTVAFQQTPCAPVSNEKPAAEDSGDRAASDDFFDFDNPFDAPQEPPEQEETAPAPAASTPSGDRQECEKTTREAIDAIDVKLQQSTNKADDREHLAELLELTRRLRECKQL